MQSSETQRQAMQFNAKQPEDLDEPEEPQELREPKDGEPKESSRETWAGGRKCHRASFANKGRDERETSREEGETRTQAEGRMRDDSGGGAEGGGMEEGR